MRCLQDELVKVRLEHAENEATIRELSARCDQQEKVRGEGRGRVGESGEREGRRRCWNSGKTD